MAEDLTVVGLIRDQLAEFRVDNKEEHREIIALLREQNGRVRSLEEWRRTVGRTAVMWGVIGAGVLTGVWRFFSWFLPYAFEQLAKR